MSEPFGPSDGRERVDGAHHDCGDQRHSRFHTQDFGAEQGGHHLPHDALRPFQDTLGPADRAVPWRSPAALRSRSS